MGAAERGLLRQGLRYALGIRLTVVAVVSLVSLILPPRPEPALAVAIMLALNLWNFWFAYRRTHGGRHWLAIADVLVLGGLCLTQVWTTASDGTTTAVSWVGVATEITVVAYPWHLGTGALAGATAVITAANLAGTALAEPAQPLGPLQLWLVMEVALSWGLFLLVRRGARIADRQVARGERLRREGAVATARRVDENDYLATLHDTASATLLMVGAGVAAGREQWLADQAARDLEVLRGPTVVPGREVDLVEMLREVVSHSPLRVRLCGAASLRVPAVDAAMLCHGTREALTNVVRHAGTDEAEVSVSTSNTKADNTVVVDVVDDGRGFDPRQVSGHRHGVTRSLVERMARIGGCAQVVSSPGAGTRVRMECPLAAAAATDEDDTEIIATNFLQGLRWAVVGMSLVILFLLDLPKLLANLDAYRPVAAQFLVMGGFLAVTALVAVATWRGRPLGRWRWPLLAFVLALSVLATETVLPEHRLGVAHWSEGDAGWWVVLLVLDSRFAILVGLLAAQYVLTFVLSVVDGHAAVTFASMVNATLIVVAYQLAVAMVAAVLRWLAAPAARAAREEEQLRTAAAVEEQLHRDRQERYAGLAETTVPLLDGLASGAMEPGDESVRRACAVEAGRMRRLFAEAAAVSDPLLHELRACIELAERNGVSVSFAECGTFPAIPTQARRTLTEPAVAVLATAREKVRLTVVGAEETVTVSVIAECSPYAVPTPDRDGVSTSTVVAGDRLWIETTWRGGS